MLFGKSKHKEKINTNITEECAVDMKVESNKVFLKYLEFMNEAMNNDYIKNIVVKLRSKKDMDIIVEIDNIGKTLPISIMIEANMYTRPDLNAKKVARGENTVSVLTHSDETIKIFVYETNEFNTIVSGKVV